MSGWATEADIEDNAMRSVPLLAVLLAAMAATSVPVHAQAQPEGKAEPPKVIHGGPRHDQQAHEAALRATAEGRRMAEPTVHAGGRHDEQLHRAALRAQHAADEAKKANAVTKP
jgi:hypothetical protein